MKTSVKIKGILATADLTYEEFAKLCGLTRQTIHNYLNGSAHIEDFEGGLKAMAVSSKLAHLALSGILPLDRSLSKEEKLVRLTELVG